MKKTSLSLMFGSFAALSLAIGCSGGGVSSGVDGDKQASELTDAEVTDVCEAALDYQADQLTTEVACTQIALVSGATDAASCVEARDACLDEAGQVEPEEEGEVDYSLCSAATAELVAECEATVAEIEECLTEQIDAVTSVSCDDLDAEAGDGDAEAGDSACDALNTDGCRLILSLGGEAPPASSPDVPEPGEPDDGTGGTDGMAGASGL